MFALPAETRAPVASFDALGRYVWKTPRNVSFAGEFSSLFFRCQILRRKGSVTHSGRMAPMCQKPPKQFSTYVPKAPEAVQHLCAKSPRSSSAPKCQTLQKRPKLSHSPPEGESAEAKPRLKKGLKNRDENSPAKLTFLGVFQTYRPNGTDPALLFPLRMIYTTRPSQDVTGHQFLYLLVISFPTLLYGFVMVSVGYFIRDDTELYVCNPPSSLHPSLRFFWYIVAFLAGGVTVVSYVLTYTILYLRVVFVFTRYISMVIINILNVTNVSEKTHPLPKLQYELRFNYTFTTSCIFDTVFSTTSNKRRMLLKHGNQYAYKKETRVTENGLCTTILNTLIHR
uniref:G_PROTEIN_RECEP_F1_2 domain-containing protein n=1 Tax=Heterorhabditis bacteriophora TaxID=37862 RepID=A0A1I7X808_HETBA